MGISDNRVDQYLKLHPKWAESTKDRYRGLINQLLKDVVDVEAMNSEGFESWLYGKKWGESARWLAFCACRQYLAWRYGSNHLALSLSIGRRDSGPQRTLKLKEIKKLLSSFNTMTAKGIRDLSMCSLMLDSGLRASEICRLEVRHLDLDERHLDVIIKGGNWGEGVFSEISKSFLLDWISIRSKYAKPDIGTVFVSLGGKKPGTEMGRDGFKVVVRRWGSASGIGEISPHVLRRTFATQATRNRAPAKIVQTAGRWSSMKMVERYTRAIEATDFEGFYPVDSAMDLGNFEKPRRGRP